MDARNTAPQQAPPATSAGMDSSEEMLAEVDEPPDEFQLSPTKLRFGYSKKAPQMTRRESLLTQQLHSETEHTDEEQGPLPQPPRALSTQSTWSNPSTASMAELTSDDGKSVPSPTNSPPLVPTHNTLPIHDKPLESRVKIVGQDDVAPSTTKDAVTEKTLEDNLGRKRCISFACRGKQEPKPEPLPATQPSQQEPKSPPKRKCALKFVCPTRSGSDSKPLEKTPPKRPVSPPPPAKRPSMNFKHRGSDSTVTHSSPKSVRKSPAASGTSTPAPEPSQQATSTKSRRYSNNSSDDDSNEATRFHEFGTSEDEPEEWVQEATCHRSRLTVNDTLKKENIIRKTCEEVEEEAIEEEEENEQDDLDDELAAVDDIDEEGGDNGNGIDEEEESDEGFHSDDEGGFASSDDESDGDSDYEWWRPGGASTAATSVEHLDRLAIVNSNQNQLASSVGSASSVQMSPKTSRINLRKTPSKSAQTPAMPIQKPDDLPDSTDFVCGTLDEDRPIEQAYINRKKQKDAAKRPVRPQDIDPSFPTSDPEMDEEDDDDVDEVAHSDDGDNDLMHGDIDELHGATATKKPSQSRPRGRSGTNRSPPPPARLRSPPPAKHVATARSPPPAGAAAKRISVARSPPPPTRRTRSPAPRKLFGNSPPNRLKSPASVKRMTSPPNSPTDNAAPLSTIPHLAERPVLTHTASLPRGGPITLSKLASFASDDDNDDDAGFATEVPKRGAIDIVKGVEWKRQRRKEKLHQKMCARAAAKGEKPHKVKPGKGAERMREVGLQLQQYHGKAEHILSL